MKWVCPKCKRHCDKTELNCPKCMTQRPESQSEKEKLNYRWERIQRLLAELRYEVQRGMMEGEIDEQIGYRFVVPVSKAIPNGVVMCEFRTRPQPAYCVNIEDHEPRLRVVK